MVGVAQVVRAPGCGPGGRGFKSPRSPCPFPRELMDGPAVRTPTKTRNASVAQLAEQGTLNPKVEGSIPSGRISLSPRRRAAARPLARSDVSGAATAGRTPEKPRLGPGLTDRTKQAKLIDCAGHGATMFENRGLVGLVFRAALGREHYFSLPFVRGTTKNRIPNTLTR
jgi:hypothetical protein